MKINLLEFGRKVLDAILIVSVCFFWICGIVWNDLQFVHYSSYRIYNSRNKKFSQPSASINVKQKRKFTIDKRNDKISDIWPNYCAQLLMATYELKRITKSVPTPINFRFQST